MDEEKIISLQSYEEFDLPPSLLKFCIQKSDKILLFPIIMNFIFQLASFYHFESIDDENFENALSSGFYSISFAINLFFNFDFLLKCIFFDESMSLKSYSLFFLFVDAISGPIALILNIYLMISYSEFILGFLHCLLTLKILTLLSIRKLLFRIYRVLPLILPIIFYIFILIYLTSSIVSKYFSQIHIFDCGNHLNALFYAFKTITFDEWGGVIKASLEHANIAEALFLIFISIFNGMCVMNFFYACVFDFLLISKNPDRISLIIDRNYQRLEKHNLLLMNKIVAGSYYSFFIVFFLIISFLKDALEFDNTTESFKIIFSMMTILFNLHFFMYFFHMRNKWDQMKDESKRKEKLTFILNLVCGPVAIIFLSYGLYSKGEIHSILNLIVIIKAFTIDRIKYIIFDNIQVALKVFHLFLIIFVFSFCLSFLGADIFRKYPNSFGNLNTAFVSILQIITLDSWNGFLDHSSFLSASLFISFIIAVLQWVILPITVAKACNTMRDSYFKIWKMNKLIPKEIKKAEFVLISRLHRVICDIEKIDISTHFFFRKKLINQNVELIKYLDCQINVESLKSLEILKELKKSIKDSKQNKVKIKFEGKEIFMKANKMLKLAKFNNNVVK